MSKRLTDLQKQRALIQEHLVWLDREIAYEQAATPITPTASAPATKPIPAPPQASSTEAFTPTPNPEGNVDAIIAEYRHDPRSLQQDTRRGCLIAFGLLLLGTFLIAGIAYALYARHLGRWW